LIDKWVVFDVLDGLHFKFRFKFFMEWIGTELFR
jgi:hypothetical protein